MIVLGLTGSIAMGKSTAATMFRRLGVPVSDADATVHRLLARGGAAVPVIARLFPDTVIRGAVDRRRLGARVFGDPDALRVLEGILHPLVRRERHAFLARMRRQRAPLVVLDIPLLYETGADRECDAVAVVSAPKIIQLQRLRRRRIGEARIAAILARQMDDAEKRRRARFVIPSGLGKQLTFRRIAAIVRTLAAPSRHPRGWA
jgi:dephospho-CoA kinase